MIPGSVGAAPVQNIGAYGVELNDFLHEVHAWDFETTSLVRLPTDDCALSYRSSRFKIDRSGRWLIIAIIVRLARQSLPILSYPEVRSEAVSLAGSLDKIRPQHVFEVICRLRRRKLPDYRQIGNAGSFFNKPVVEAQSYDQLPQLHPDLKAYSQDNGRWKLVAGWLMVQGGWKGYKLGPVGVHDHHALVLVNHGNARAEDLLSLAEKIQVDVSQRFGVLLEIESIYFSGGVEPSGRAKRLSIEHCCWKSARLGLRVQIGCYCIRHSFRALPYPEVVPAHISTSGSMYIEPHVINHLVWPHHIHLQQLPS